MAAPLVVAARAQTPTTTISGTTGQQSIVVRGGWIFTATATDVVRNQGFLIVGGRLEAVNRPISTAEAAGARIVQLRDDEYVLPADTG